MSIRDDRLAANQEPFRSANRGMIEAADFGCLGRVEASFLEYEEAHGGNDRYFILPGHPRIEGEDIVSENGRYEVVSKAL